MAMNERALSAKEHVAEIPREYKKRHMIMAGVMAVTSYMVLGCIPGASLAVLLPTMIQEMGMSPVQAASLAAGVSLGTAAFTFVAGVVLDKISARVLIAIFGLGAALVVGLRAIEMDFAMFYLLFPMLGIFHGVLSPGFNKMIALWYPKKYLFLMNALLIAGGAFAFIIGLNFTLAITEMLGGWRDFFAGLGVLMAILAILWIVVIPERSSKDAALNADVAVKHGGETTFWQNIKIVMSSPKVWFLCLSEFFFAGVVACLTNLGPITIDEMFAGAIPMQQSAFIASTGNMGSLVGYIVLPLILMKYFPKADKTWPVAISMIIAPAVWIVGLSVRNVPLLIFCLAFGSFWNGFGYVGPRTMLMELPEVAGLRAGTALGVFNTLSRMGTTVVLSFAGYLVIALDGYQNALRAAFCLAVLAVVFLAIYKILLNRDLKKAL